jgi:transposase InsO family protein
MSKARVVVLEIVSGRLTVTGAAKTYGLSRQHVHRLLKRYREGPVTLQWHLARAGLRVPSTSTIRRILHHHGLISPQPYKRPKSSYHHFAAAQPNECWQSDFTHWQLADGVEVEILNWLDDHSRYLLTCTAYRRVGGSDVVASFLDTVNTYGLPASTLTDNGAVYTSRFTHGHNEFELLLGSLGVTQKNGHPGHPQTQGKVERFHQTLKRWLTPRPRPTTLADMQNQLDTFRAIYNTDRPHRAHHPRTTPAQAYTALPKASPPGLEPTEHFRIRHDTVDQFGKLTLRHASRLHHLGIAAPTLAPKSSSSSPQPTSWCSTPPATNSSPATTSTPMPTTGATDKKAPADGRHL